MVSRIGEQWQWFDGKVVDVKDPKKSGRVRVRIKGYHDDETKIPNDKLPWAQVLMPVSSAGVNKVGASPTGLLPGSNVIGFWYDVERKEMPFVFGSYVKAGDLEKGGTTSGGTEPIKENTNSGPPQFRPKGKDDAGGDRNPKPLENALDPKTKRNNDEELPKKSITEVAADGLAFAAQKTIGALAGGLQSEVLNTISQIDPSNVSGSISTAVNAMMKVDAISMVMNASGLFGMASSAMQSMASQVINQLGGNAAAIGNVIGTLSSFMNSPEFRKMSSVNQLMVANMATKLIENPTSAAFSSVAPSVVPSLNNPSQLINSVASQAIATVSNQFTDMFLNRNITGAAMEGLIGNLSSSLATNGLKAIFGSGFDPNNILGQASKILGGAGSNILQAVSSDLPKTVLEVSKIQNVFEEGTKAIMRVKEKGNQAKLAKNEEEAIAEGIHKANVAAAISNNVAPGSEIVTTASNGTVFRTVIN